MLADPSLGSGHCLEQLPSVHVTGLEAHGFGPFVPSVDKNHPATTTIAAIAVANWLPIDAAGLVPEGGSQTLLKALDYFRRLQIGVPDGGVVVTPTGGVVKGSHDAGHFEGFKRHCLLGDGWRRRLRASAAPIRQGQRPIEPPIRIRVRRRIVVQMAGEVIQGLSEAGNFALRMCVQGTDVEWKQCGVRPLPSCQKVQTGETILDRQHTQMF